MIRNPLNPQFVEMLAEIREFNQAGLSWDFIKELTSQVLDAEEAEAVIFLNSTRNKWLCLSIESNELVETLPIHWKLVLDFAQSPRDRSCVAAFVTKDRQLIHLFDGGSTL